MRGFFRFLFGFLFIVTVTSLVTIFALKSTLLSREYVLLKLNKYDLYTKAYNVIPEITETLASEGEDPDLTGEQMGRVVTSSVTPVIIKEKSENFLNGFYGWLYGEGTAIPEISLLDIKPTLENYAAVEMDVPQEVIESGQTDFKIPEKIQVQPVPPLLLLRQVYSKYTTSFVSLLFMSLAFFAAVVALSGKGLANYIRRPGTPMIVLSIWLFLNVGGIWLLVNAGNLMYKQIAGALSGAAGTTDVAYGLAKEVAADITGKVIIFAGLFLLAGVTLKIVGYIVKRMQGKEAGGKPNKEDGKKEDK